MSSKGMLKLLLSTLLTMAVSINILGAVRAAGPTDKDVNDIAATLTCATCQGQSVADSSSPLALQIRDVIRDKLAQGESRQQIVQYFVDRYGDEILLEQPNVLRLLWSPPVLWGIGGLGLIGSALYYWRSRQPALTASAPIQKSEKIAATAMRSNNAQEKTQAKPQVWKKKKGR